MMNLHFVHIKLLLFVLSYMVVFGCFVGYACIRNWRGSVANQRGTCSTKPRRGAA
jgi:hypothetical protein